LVAKLIEIFGRVDASNFLAGGKRAGFAQTAAAGR
jgi:hypothetical protein